MLPTTMNYNLSIRVYGQLVTGDLRIDIGHLGNAPSEGGSIILQTSAELPFHEFGEAFSDLDTFR
ncbi:hypothetical protein A2U01_0089378, partial [Trifolium medium]|nr:hypothetical protein [Trifolium medium]